MQSKLQQVRHDLKQARNMAYLGKYQQSIKFFKKIIDSVQQELILNNVPRSNIEDWRKFEKQVIAQKTAVQSIKYMLSGMHNGSVNSFVRSDDRPIAHKNHSIQIQDPNRKTNLNFRSTNRGFSARKPTNLQQNAVFKDPDVWDSPPPLEKRQSNQKITKPQSNVNARSHPVKNIGSKKKVQAGGQGQKSFLLDRYPDGNGPDTNLIEMLQRQVVNKSPKVLFDDIAELQTAKGLLQQAVLLPLKMPQFFTGIRRAWKGVLMFGPPGTGKTMLAKAVASSGGTTFFNVSASSLASKWKGESQKLVRILFEMAKFYAPAVIFFDQIDALGGRRKEGQDESNRKVKTELLVQMDGATTGSNEQNKFVIVLAATNRPWDLDQALRRRLQKRIYIPLPTEKGRKQLLNINLKNLKIQQNLDLQFIIKKTDGYSGADITNVCREAAYMPMRRKLKKEGGFKNIMDLKQFEEQVSVPLNKADFTQALKNVNKSVGKEDLHKYQQWMNEFGTI